MCSTCIQTTILLVCYLQSVYMSSVVLSLPLSFIKLAQIKMIIATKLFLKVEVIIIACRVKIIMGGITQDCMQHEIQCTVPVSAVCCSRRR